MHNGPQWCFVMTFCSVSLHLHWFPMIIKKSIDRWEHLTLARITCNKVLTLYQYTGFFFISHLFYLLNLEYFSLHVTWPWHSLPFQLISALKVITFDSCRCPSDFCAPPTVVTITSTTAYLTMDIPLPPRTRTIIAFRFRTMLVQLLPLKILTTWISEIPPNSTMTWSTLVHFRASSGMLFYLGGPAFLTVFMSSGGRLVLGLNTRVCQCVHSTMEISLYSLLHRCFHIIISLFSFLFVCFYFVAQGSGAGVYNSTSSSYNDGEWHYIRVFREGNRATLEDGSGATTQVFYSQYSFDWSTLLLGLHIIVQCPDFSSNCNIIKEYPWSYL